MSYAQDTFPTEYTPTVFDNYNCTMVLNDKINVSLGLWDTAVRILHIYIHMNHWSWFDKDDIDITIVKVPFFVHMKNQCDFLQKKQN